MAYRRRMALVVHIMSPCVRPKRVHKQEMHISPTYCAFQTSHEDAKESLQLSEPGVFWITLGSLVHPNGPINRKYTFFPRILMGLEGPESAIRANNEASRTHREGEGGGFTLALPPPRRLRPDAYSYSWCAPARLGQAHPSIK